MVDGVSRVNPVHVQSLEDKSRTSMFTDISAHWRFITVDYANTERYVLGCMGNIFKTNTSLY